ncbi:MAG: hypothetical protein K2K68_10200 [Duncaniella sp.]|nr:hypothetical protein [Duncaniella sp.]
MRLLLYPIIILLLLSVFGSCSRHDYDDRLLRAESIIFDSPDSSLLILESISPDELNRESDRALYALLLTETLEKLHLNPTDDSLISIAADYYDNHTDVERQVRSHYYRGIVQYHNDRYSPAIVNYFQARDIAGKNDMYFWRGLACRGISDIYNETYNSIEELNYAREEYEYTLKSGRQPYVNYAMLDLAKALSNDGKIDESLHLISIIEDSAKLHSDEYLYYGAKQLLATNMIVLGKNEEAFQILKDSRLFPFFEKHDSFLLGYTLIETNRLKETEDFLKSFIDDKELNNIGLKYLYEAKRKNYELAFEVCENALNLTNKEIKRAVNHALTTSLNEYFNLKDEQIASELDSARLKNRLLFISVFLIAIILVGLSILVYNRQKKKIEEKVIFAEQLKEDLDRISNQSISSGAIIQKLLISKYKLLEELSTIVMQTRDSRTARRKIADTVTGLINDFTIGTGRIEEIVNEINKTHDNLLEDFKADLPDIKDADYKLYLFSVIGFSNAVISLFLNEEKIEAVYNRRRRLKDKIKKLDEEKQLRYLKFL